MMFSFAALIHIYSDLTSFLLFEKILALTADLPGMSFKKFACKDVEFFKKNLSQAL